MIAALAVSFLLAGGPPAPPTSISWEELFAASSPTAIEFSARAKEIEGTRVRLRGYRLASPKLPGGVYLTRVPEVVVEHDQADVPWDAVAVLWDPALEIPDVPSRPTVEGTLRLGNRDVGGHRVVLALENARPFFEPRRRRPKSTSVPR